MKLFKSITASGFQLLILLMAALFLISCSSAKLDSSLLTEPKEPKSNLSVADLNGEWVLLGWALPTSAEGIMRNREVPLSVSGKPVSIFFDFNKSHFSGYAGCNRFFSSLELNTQNMIKLGPIASTKMMCTENLRMNFEHDFVKVLGNSHDWALNGNALQLFTDAGDTLSFSRRR